MDEQEMEIEISLLIELVIADRLVRKSPYAHESPRHTERIKRRDRAYQLLSSETRQRIMLGVERHRAR